METNCQQPFFLPVSIIVPLFQGVPFFPALLETLKGQGACELIVVIDDGSSLDELAQLTTALPTLKVTRTTGGIGTALARNAGAKLASREYLLFLDQDDQLPTGFVEAILQHVPGTVAYDNQYAKLGASGLIHTGSTVFERARWSQDHIDVRSSRLLLRGFPMLKLLIPAASFDALGGYRPILGVEDFDLVWRLVASGETIKTVREPSGLYLLHAESTTERLASDRQAFISSRLTWLRIYSDMSRASGFGLATRARAAVICITLVAQVMAHQAVDTLQRGARGFYSPK